MGPRGTVICLAYYVEEDCNSKAKLLLSENSKDKTRKMPRKVKDEHADTQLEQQRF